MTDPTEPTAYVLTIRGEPGYRGSLLDRLRPFLKRALRAYGIRCVAIEPLRPTGWPSRQQNAAQTPHMACNGHVGHEGTNENNEQEGVQ